MNFKRKLLTFFISTVLITTSGCGLTDENSFFPLAEQTSSQNQITTETEGTISSSISDVIEETTASSTISESLTVATAPESEVSVTAVTASTAATAVPVTEPTVPESYSGIMKVHFIDVEQGDSILIELPNSKTMLIDAGESEYGDRVTTYIYTQGYDTLDYVVASHAHSDHIGGLANVINSFNVKNFYMTSAAHASNAYENMLISVKNNKADVHDVMAGDIILSEANLMIEVVAPKVIDSEEQNNNSIVVKLTYGERKFLFTGDAEKNEEDGIWTNIKCDVLKVGHHGSNSSSTANFLKKVEPSYAVISCGLSNSYGHPTDDVLKRLNDRNIKTYRTDLQGTIIFETDGQSITVNVNPSKYLPPAVTTTTTAAQQVKPPVEAGSTTYVLNKNTKKIHYAYCSSVGKMKESNKIFTNDYDQAIANGYTPCKICKP